MSRHHLQQRDDSVNSKICYNLHGISIYTDLNLSIVILSFLVEKNNLVFLNLFNLNFQ